MSGPNILNFGSKVVFLNGQPVTLPNSASDPGTAAAGDMYYNSVSNVIRYYNGSTWQNISSGSSNYTVNKFTLSPTDISNGFVTLTSTPTTLSDTILDVVGGVMQDYSVDFIVTGNVLSWNGLGLAAIPLVSGDKLIVQFD